MKISFVFPILFALSTFATDKLFHSFVKFLYFCIIKPVSHLPFWVLYGISDFLCFVFRYTKAYRRDLVYRNLRASFPEKSEKEIKKIMYRFYRHFCDLIVEGVKLFSISPKKLQQRLVFENPEILDPYFERNQSVSIVSGHLMSWEMVATIMGGILKHQFVGMYSPLTNPFFDKIFMQSRSKCGMYMLNKKDANRFFIQQHEKPYAMFFVGDQSTPPWTKRVYWLRFLNQNTDVFLGTEKYSQRYKLPVFFLEMRKMKKRGHYFAKLHLLFEQPQDTAEGEITRRHTSTLEKLIQEMPDAWLWTHNRWKNRNKFEKEGVGDLKSSKHNAS